jgi:hypothetical protein
MSGEGIELLKAFSKGANGRPVASPDRGTSTADASEDEDECVAFGYLRGVRDRALAIEFRLANGNREAFPYSWLGPMKYNPSAGLLLKFVGDAIYLVVLEGSNFASLVNGSASLFDRGIQRHRVTWVREMSRLQIEKAGAGEVTVEHIRLVSYRPDDKPPDADWLEPFGDRGDAQA